MDTDQLLILSEACVVLISRLLKSIALRLAVQSLVDIEWSACARTHEFPSTNVATSHLHLNCAWVYVIFCKVGRSYLGVADLLRMLLVRNAIRQSCRHST